MRHDIVMREIKDWYLLANEKPPEQFERIISLWQQQTEEIPVEYLEKSLKLAFKSNKRTKFPKPYQVIDSANEIRNSTIKSGPATQEDEQYRGLKDSDFPTPEQHKLAIRCISAVAQGTIDKNEGHGWLEKIFSGKLDKKDRDIS